MCDKVPCEKELLYCIKGNKKDYLEASNMFYHVNDHVIGCKMYVTNVQHTYNNL